MSTLLANQAVEAAIASILVECGIILGIFAAYLKVRTTQAVQGEKIDAVQQQQAKQGTAVLVTPVAPVTQAAQVAQVEPAPTPQGPLVAASVQCPHCSQQVHLDSLIPVPEAQAT